MRRDPLASLGARLLVTRLPVLETLIAFFYLLLVVLWAIRPDRSGRGGARFRPWTGDPDDWVRSRRERRTSGR